MTLNIAHRGARSLAPENTLAAIRKAWATGADILEIDVGVSLDGRLIVLHDETLQRTTDAGRQFPHRARNPCTTFTLAEIRSLDAGSWFIDSDPFGQIAAGQVSLQELQLFKGAVVPTLEEVLKFVKDTSWRVNIEIKQVPPPLQGFPAAAAVLQCIERQTVPAKQIIISSFVHDSIRTVHKQRPDIEINALIGPSIIGPQDWGGYEFPIYNACALCTDEEQIRAAHRHGCQVNLYTVNSPAQMQRFIRAGVRGIFTDFPQILSRILAQQN
ncbi:MAG: glycerophosphodiester phosphodiesterase family protein [Desulfocapsaceae bacterium]|nr:glycerophosphodiester phosphodiesterase family protein [Desulfocapsaceae bacterium]